jgi:hypothetical protein
MLVGVFILVALGGLFWLAYRRPRPRRWLIPRRQPAATRAETTLTPTAVLESLPALESELGRPLGPDACEQASRWVEAAAALRKSRRSDALPTVLRCAGEASELPQGALLAAEAVGFANFAAALQRLSSRDGRLAVRAIAGCSRGCRNGTVDLAALVRVGLGSYLAAISETAPAVPDPWLTAAVLEAERASRRADHWARLLPADVRQLAERLCEVLGMSAARRRGWLAGAADRLIARFPVAATDEQTATLRVLEDMRADVSALFPSLPDRRAAWWEDAVRALRWAKVRHTDPDLAALADRLMTSRRPCAAAPVALAALAGSRCREAEAVLLRASHHREPAVRAAAAGAFGWSESADTGAVIAALQTGRNDRDGRVRQASVAALARFGELAALREFALGLIAEDPVVRHTTMLTAADEGVSWLWPDLDLVAGAADPDTALIATEALERMREAALGVAN